MKVKASSTTGEERIALLTPRERDIAGRLALGATNAEIAADLEISTKTVDTHRAHVLKKLELRNNVELARFAIAYALVEAPIMAVIATETSTAATASVN